jgi:hypothetical protein
MARAVLFAFGVVVLLGSTGWARQDDPVKGKLDKAKTAYDEQVDKLRDGLLKTLQDKEEAARKKGDKKLVDQIKGEREAFESSGELPKSVPTANYLRDYKQARSTLELAYTTAVKEYTKAKKDDEAAAVEKDLAAFKEDATQPGATLAVLLTKDSLWTGARRTATAKGKVSENPFRMTIASRDGKGFKGEIVIDKTRKYDIEGIVEGNKIAFATEKQGNFKQSFEGRLRGKSLELAFVGTGVGNEKVKGIVVLTLEKGK